MSTSDSLPHRARQREATRQRIYDAALEVFARDGVATARIEDITRRAQVSRGAFYFHFPTREDVLIELLRHAEGDFVQAIERLPEDAPLEVVFGRVAEVVTLTWSARPRLFAEVGVVALRRTAGELGRDRDGIRAVLARRFARAATRGELRADLPANVLSDLYLANLFAVSVGWCAAPGFPLEPALRLSAVLFLDGARGTEPVR